MKVFIIIFCKKNTFLYIEIHSDAEVFDIYSNNCDNLISIL